MERSYPLAHPFQGSRKLVKSLYCSVLLWFVGRAITKAPDLDRDVREEIESLPTPFSLCLGILPKGPAMALRKESTGSVKRIKATGQEDLRVLIKNLEAAFLLFSFQESTCVSQARNRLVAEGPIPETCTFVRILNRIEILLLPRFIAERAVKRYVKPPGLLGKRILLYLRVLFG